MNPKITDPLCEIAACVLLVLIIVSISVLHRREDTAPQPAQQCDTGAAVVSGTFSTEGAKPQFAFPIISGTRNVAEFASDLADGYRSDGKIEAELLLPTNMRQGSKAAAVAGTASAASSGCSNGQCSQSTGWHWERRGFRNWVQVEDDSQ